MTDFTWPPFIGTFGTVLPTYLALLGGYLLGSVPFGLLLTKIAGLGDIRSIGSGNIGATNVLRTGNKRLAATTLILDGGKGAAAALIGHHFAPGLAYLAAAATFIGHLYPIWLRFNGGKGVATFLGIHLALAWPVGLAACLTWFLAALAFRMSSLSALLAAALTPLYGYFFNQPALVLLSLFLALMIFWRHRSNIGRILAGTEPRIGSKNKQHVDAD